MCIVGCSIADITLANEAVHRSRDDVAKYLLEIADVMHECASRYENRWCPAGRSERQAPGEGGGSGWCTRTRPGAGVRRGLGEPGGAGRQRGERRRWAGGHRSTNGAAGIVPAVLYYARRYTSAGRADHDDATVRFLLTAVPSARAIKEHASISGADVGCQGEVGRLPRWPPRDWPRSSAAHRHRSRMPPRSRWNTASVSPVTRSADWSDSVHRTQCDLGGRAINAARMALRGDGTHRVSLDQVIATMRDTGRDMHSKYKETATGGLAVHVPLNIVECLTIDRLVRVG